MTLLDAVLNPPEQGAEVMTPLYAEFNGEQVLVRAVLERTAVYELHGELLLARLELFEPTSELTWFPMRPPPRGARGDDKTLEARARAARGRALALERRLADPSRRAECLGSTTCGTMAGYKNGCRGDKCMEGNREYNRERQRRRVQGPRVEPRV